MGSFSIPWPCLDLCSNKPSEENTKPKAPISFSQAVNNVCEIPLSQLPQACVKGDRLAIAIPEKDYVAGMEKCKHNLHGRIIWPKGSTPLSVVAAKNSRIEQNNPKILENRVENTVNVESDDDIVEERPIVELEQFQVQVLKTPPIILSHSTTNSQEQVVSSNKFAALGDLDNDDDQGLEDEQVPKIQKSTEVNEMTPNTQNTDLVKDTSECEESLQTSDQASGSKIIQDNNDFLKQSWANMVEEDDEIEVSDNPKQPPFTMVQSKAGKKEHAKKPLTPNKPYGTRSRRLVSNNNPDFVFIAEPWMNFSDLLRVNDQQLQELTNIQAQLQSSGYTDNLRSLERNAQKEVIPSLINDDVNTLLTLIPSQEEIKNAVFILNKDGAPGPDGYGAFFYQKYWEIIQEDVVNAVLQFFTTGWILPSFNSNTIILIPKTSNADSMDQFRPIAMANFKFKIISKVLADRGVRQGDPLSPLLFCLAEEVLSRGISKLVVDGNMELIKGSRNSLVPSHCLYANDIMVFCSAELCGAMNAIEIAASKNWNNLWLETDSTLDGTIAYC
ncbi:hypothetical protein P8452_26715 [Trifolium repens]|nr:hypothetical protein P8452_26715 [Trifolium repens]